MISIYLHSKKSVHNLHFILILWFCDGLFVPHHLRLAGAGAITPLPLSASEAKPKDLK